MVETEFYDAQEDVFAYDIDASIDILQAQVHQQKPPPKLTRATPAVAFPRMSKEKWYKLSPEAREIWDQLDDRSKSIILAPPQKLTPNLARKINMHEISAYDYLMANLHLSMEDIGDDPAQVHSEPPEPAPPEDPIPSDQVLVNAAKQSKSTPHPADIRHVLSNKPKNATTPAPKATEEIVVNGKTYHQVHLHTYSVSASKSSSAQSLVDHGANGGIGGSDVQVIYKTHCSVDVQGINNHQMVDIPIATVGGVINTQHGEVIAILHQYAYTGIGTSIHSPAQLEWYKNDVNDKSIKVGGLQCITTLDGYVIPLNIVQGLPRMTIHPFTDQEWEDLPHVILTSELDWDPRQLDIALEDDDQWFDAVSDIEGDPFTNLFDEFGNYCHPVVVQSTNLHPSIDDIVKCCVYAAQTQLMASHPPTTDDGPTTVPHATLIYIAPKKRDYKALRPFLVGYLLMLLSTLLRLQPQYARIPTSTILKKHFKLPNPALNVH